MKDYLISGISALAHNVILNVGCLRQPKLIPNEGYFAAEAHSERKLALIAKVHSERRLFTGFAVAARIA
jgi:hypothetical protein